MHTHSTSRMRILVPKDRWYTFSRLSVDFSHRLYVNGIWLMDVGSPGWSKENEIPNTRRITFTVQPQAASDALYGVIELVQQSSNFVHRVGTGHHNWHMESGSLWADVEETYSLQYSIILGCYLMMSLLFFLLFLFYKNRSVLYFSLFCLAWFLRVGVIRGKLFTLLLPWMGWHAKFRIEYMAVPVAIALTFAIIAALFPAVLHKIALRIIYITSAAFAAVFLFASTMFMSYALQPLYAVYALAIVYLIASFVYRFFISSPRPRLNIEQGIFLGGFVVFAFAAVVDLFFYNNIFFAAYIPNFIRFIGNTTTSMLLFAICAATSVFIATMKEVEETKQKEIELAMINMTLEERIEQVQTQFADLLKERDEAHKDILLESFASHKLSKREREVAELVFNGLANNVIAERLFITEIAIKKKMTSILKKYNAKNRTELVSKILYSKELSEPENQ